MRVFADFFIYFRKIGAVCFYQQIKYYKYLRSTIIHFIALIDASIEKIKENLNRNLNFFIFSNFVLGTVEDKGSFFASISYSRNAHVPANAMGEKTRTFLRARFCRQIVISRLRDGATRHGEQEVTALGRSYLAG